MSVAQKLKTEIRLIALTTLYFGLWLGMLMLLKVLVLDEYKIAFHGYSLALSGALLAYNCMRVFNRHLGAGGLAGMLLVPLPEQDREASHGEKER